MSCHLVDLVACSQFGIPRLVYTSTYNVVFGGQRIENGDETMPYLPLDKVNRDFKLMFYLGTLRKLLLKIMLHIYVFNSTCLHYY